MVLSAEKMFFACALSEGIAYGFSVLLFGYTLWYISRHRHVDKPMVFGSSILMGISTVHIILYVKRVIDGLSSDIPPEDYFQLLNAESMVGFSLYCVQTLLGDAMLIYRCYIVWQSSRYIIAIPSMLCLAAVAVNIAWWACKDFPTHVSDIFTSKGARFLAPWYCLTFVTNLIATLLLVYRILQLAGKASLMQSRVMQRHAYPIMKVILDAGVMYAAIMIIVIVMFLHKSPTFIIARNLVVPVVTITFNMILLRITRAKARKQESLRVLTDSAYSAQPAHPQGTIPIPLTPISAYLLDPVVSNLPQQDQHGPAAAHEGLVREERRSTGREVV